METALDLHTQWRSPDDVLNVLMIIGGDVVRAALAQSTGKFFTPICFSFGWVAYAFIALVGVLGDGRLLPPPDYPVKVFNLESGYVRDNKNWVIGRIVRDHEAHISRTIPWDDGVRISIYNATENKNAYTKFSWSAIHVYGLLLILVQLGIASVPAILYQEWSILLITGGGTILGMAFAALPQWTAEKLPNDQTSSFSFALTAGNGSKDILIIHGHGRCLNLEEFAVTDTPRSGRTWRKFNQLPKRGEDGFPGPHEYKAGKLLGEGRDIFGFPLGFCLTVAAAITQLILWLALLITISSLKTHTWFLLAVGAIGMFQNGVVAAVERPAQTRNLPLQFKYSITTWKVMDALMDLHLMLKEFEPKCGAESLVNEFFPGSLRPDEKDWWNGEPDSYDAKRRSDARRRGLPPRYTGHSELEADDNIGASLQSPPGHRNMSLPSQVDDYLGSPQRMQTNIQETI